MRSAESSQLWDREYSLLKVIPSSTRKEPSKALLLFAELLDLKTFENALDAGAGNGRNSIYLSQKGLEVHAVDFSPVALEMLRSRAEREGLSGRIRTHRASLLERLPFGSEYFDLVLDSYLLCHFFKGERERYRDELIRVLKSDGVLLSWLFLRDDEYYESLNPWEEGEATIVRDPNNEIEKQLYAAREFEDFWTPALECIYLIQFEFSDVVLGSPYRRSVVAIAAKKPR
jgi:SAM-dependent methyltransferase